MELKQIAMALQNLATQIQSVGMQISHINFFLSNQIQNLSVEVSNYANTIFNIGMRISNNQNFSQNILPNPPNKEKDFNGKGINNFIYLNEEDYKNKINIRFTENYKTVCIVFIDKEKTIEELLNNFLGKMNLNSNYFKNHWFLFNAEMLDPKSTLKLKNIGGLIDGSTINIVEKQLNIC